MRVLALLGLLAPVAAFLPTGTPAGRVATKLAAAHVKAGGEYRPGVVEYGTSTDSIVETLEKLGNFKTVLKGLEVAGLKDDLNNKEKIFTVYLPNDAAFEKLPAGELDGLLADKTKLADLLKYHVVPLVVKDKESIRAFRLSNKPTLHGGRVRINVRPNPDGEQFVIFNNGEANIVEADIDAANGTIHEIDSVLTPQAGGVIPPK